MAGKVLGGVCRVRARITGSVIWEGGSVQYMEGNILLFHEQPYIFRQFTFSATYNEMLIETASKQTHTEMVSGIISKIQLFNSMTTWTLQGTIYNINLTLYKQHLLYRAL